MNLGSASGSDGVKDCRTTVIPKVDNPRSDAEDFRSITIGLCMYRLFSKIVTNPLSELTPLNRCQKPSSQARMALLTTSVTWLRSSNWLAEQKWGGLRLSRACRISGRQSLSNVSCPIDVYDSD
ncbi:Ribosome-recycling factor [Trichinella spiralis]|uniref:Ribosome-recycling factor n=1 Tax=Trichinella spiralis TaxID=6334 RepID=A0ABR3KM10_TRISP